MRFISSLIIASLLMTIGALLADTFLSAPCAQSVAGNPGKGGGKKTGQ